MGTLWVETRSLSSVRKALWQDSLLIRQMVNKEAMSWVGEGQKAERLGLSVGMLGLKNIRSMMLLFSLKIQRANICEFCRFNADAIVTAVW